VADASGDIVVAMPRDRPLPGGKLEYAVLVAVWQGGAVTVRELHERVGAPLGLGYTTTARVLDRLHVKKLVARVKEGKLLRYRAAVSQHEIERARLTRTLSSVLTEGTRPAGASGEDLAVAVVTVARIPWRPLGAAMAGLTGAEISLTSRVHRLLAPLPPDVGRRSIALPLAVLAVLVASVAVGVAYGDDVLRAMPFIGI